jgi:hypothetical protein
VAECVVCEKRIVFFMVVLTLNRVWFVLFGLADVGSLFIGVEIAGEAVAGRCGGCWVRD